MVSRSDQAAFSALEDMIASVNRAADEAAALLRVLAPVAGGMPDLQRALTEFRTATPSSTATVTAPTVPMRAPAPLPPAAPPAPADYGPQLQEADATMDATAAPADIEPEAEPAASAAEPEPPAPEARAGAAAPAIEEMYKVSVMVSRTDGPLDLVRVHTALDGLAGASGVTLASYTRNRAVLLLDTDLPSDALPLAKVLLAAFPEGVEGHWLGETDFVATIGAAGGATP